MYTFSFLGFKRKGSSERSSVYSVRKAKPKELGKTVLHPKRLQVQGSGSSDRNPASIFSCDFFTPERRTQTCFTMCSHSWQGRPMNHREALFHRCGTKNVYIGTSRVLEITEWPGGWGAREKNISLLLTHPSNNSSASRDSNPLMYHLFLAPLLPECLLLLALLNSPMVSLHHPACTCCTAPRSLSPPLLVSWPNTHPRVYGEYGSPTSRRDDEQTLMASSHCPTSPGKDPHHILLHYLRATLKTPPTFCSGRIQPDLCPWL